MQHCDDEDADTQDTEDPLATLIIEKQRNNVTKGTQQVYDCYLKGFLKFCFEQGYTSENHSQVLSIPKEQRTCHILSQLEESKIPGHTRKVIPATHILSQHLRA